MSLPALDIAGNMQSANVPFSFCGGRKPSDFGVFAYNKITSDFGILNIISNIFKTTQNLRFWSYCGGRKPSDFGVIAVDANPPILEFLRIIK